MYQTWSLRGTSMPRERRGARTGIRTLGGLASSTQGWGRRRGVVTQLLTQESVRAVQQQSRPCSLG